MNRNDLIRALKDERQELATRLEAIDHALVGFGVTAPHNKPRSKRGGYRGNSGRSHEARLEFDNTILGVLREYNDWVSATTIAALAEVPLNGTIYGALNRLRRKNAVIRREVTEGGGRIEWRIMPDREVANGEPNPAG